MVNLYANGLCVGGYRLYSANGGGGITLSELDVDMQATLVGSVAIDLSVNHLSIIETDGSNGYLAVATGTGGTQIIRFSYAGDEAESFNTDENGGTFTLFNNKLKIEVPDGSLGTDQEIDVSLERPFIIPGIPGEASIAFEFTPAGLTFTSPITIYWYGDFDPAITYSVIYYDPGTGAKTTVPVTVAADGSYITFSTDHFSKFVLYPRLIDLGAGTLTDPRDENEYKTITIGDQVWMAENLAYLPAVSPSAIGSETDPHYYVYDYQGSDVGAAKAEANYSTYGALYNFSASLNACPDGWHLPSDEEWKTLEKYLGMSSSDADGQSAGASGGLGYRESGVVGKKMKSTSGWNDNGNGDNSSGMNILPGDSRSYSGNFNDLGSFAHFRTSTEQSLTETWFRGFYAGSDGVWRGYSNRAGGHSIRCLKGAALPTIATTAASSVTHESATSGGNISNDGGAAVTARGVCWSTSQNPTITDSKTEDGTGTGSYTSSITGLSAETTYYARAYATNSDGTAYGNEESFTTTIQALTFTDARDGHEYEYVEIGTQTWMAENLAWLPAVSPSSAGSDTDPYYYVYNYEGSSVSVAKISPFYTLYGVLYNWSASLNACPAGWHLPTNAEWTILTDYLTNNGYGYGGSGDDIGKSMASTLGWTASSTAGDVGNDTNSNNSSGFSALAGGCRWPDRGFTSFGTNATFWSSTEGQFSYSSTRNISSYSENLSNGSAIRGLGFSVRCLKN